MKRFWLMFLVGAVGLLSCAQAQVRFLVPEVIETYPHDPEAFTQGLLLYEGLLYESTGLYGRSSLRQVDPETGEVLQQVDLDDAFFGEGLALVDDRLIQITWREETAFVYDLTTFERLGRLSYGGEGWGLCFDGELLVMSNGSDTLTFRDPETMDVRHEVRVTMRGEPLPYLNELECVGDYVYANVFTTTYIVQIDKGNGQVVAVIDASNLLPQEELQSLLPEGVLNGIAYNPEDDTFLLTGKLWPHVFKVRFQPAAR
jgi:glutamine cyclotransferase